MIHKKQAQFLLSVKNFRPAPTLNNLSLFFMLRPCIIDFQNGEYIMIVKSLLVAWLLTQPTLVTTEIDYHYKPCADLYEKYIIVKEKEIVAAAYLAENIRLLCKPINHGVADL